MTSRLYFRYDGTDIINSAQTELLAAEMGLNWFKPIYENDFMQQYDEGAIESPPWLDPFVPASSGFAGAYPLSVSGINDSTRGSTIIQSTQDGGVPGRVRFGIKTVVFSVALIGLSEEAVQYGLAWLSRALLGAECSDTTRIRSFGFDLEYLDADPVVDPDDGDGLEGTYRRLYRRLRHVTFNQGPQIISSATLPGCAGHVTVVTFTASVGDPFEYGYETAIFENYPAATVFPDPDYAEEYSGPITFADPVCGVDIYDPLFDPVCPVLVVPPNPPSVAVTCYEPPPSWQRRQIAISGLAIPRWNQMVPRLSVRNTTGTDSRGIRVRFFRNTAPEIIPITIPDQCDYLADYVITYLPANSTMMIDAVAEEISILTATGERRRADSLVSATDGTPFTWPALSCGEQHIMTLDLDVTENPAFPGTDTASIPDVDLSLVPRYL